MISKKIKKKLKKGGAPNSNSNYNNSIHNNSIHNNSNYNFNNNPVNKEEDNYNNNDFVEKSNIDSNYEKELKICDQQLEEKKNNLSSIELEGKNKIEELQKNLEETETEYKNKKSNIMNEIKNLEEQKNDLEKIIHAETAYHQKKNADKSNEESGWSLFGGGKKKSKKQKKVSRKNIIFSKK